jgi:hypothetical protein
MDRDQKGRLPRLWVLQARFMGRDERDWHWKSRIHAGDLHAPLVFGLVYSRGPSHMSVPAHRCTVRHPTGEIISVSCEDSAVAIPTDLATAFQFIYGGQNSDFPLDAPEPVSGRYEVTWELLFDRGPWREVCRDWRDISSPFPALCRGPRIPRTRWRWHGPNGDDT